MIRVVVHSPVVAGNVHKVILCIQSEGCRSAWVVVCGQKLKGWTGKNSAANLIEKLCRMAQYQQIDLHRRFSSTIQSRRCSSTRSRSSNSQLDVHRARKLPMKHQTPFTVCYFAVHPLYPVEATAAVDQPAIRFIVGDKWTNGWLAGCLNGLMGNSISSRVLNLFIPSSDETHAASKIIN